MAFGFASTALRTKSMCAGFLVVDWALELMTTKSTPL